MINSKSKQRGLFSVEFAIVGGVLGLLLLFTFDVVAKIAMKGKLDRLSFSAVSLVKERTQLYGDDYTMSGADAGLVYRVIRKSLARTTGDYDSNNFGMRLEEQTYATDHSANALQTFNRGNQTCAVQQQLSEIEDDLSVVTTWGRKATLYRVTLCYETDDLLTSVLGSGFTTVSSSSVVIGR